MFVSGTEGKPTGATSVEVATGTPGGPAPTFRSYPATGTAETGKWGRHDEVTYHRARVEGAAARAQLKQVLADRERSWLWRVQGEEAVHSVGKRTLAAPAQRVLDACAQ
ncbi:MAG: hypothetical protein OXU81_02590 [Gammaproteobacteria bacterium]|nr:hypothetical protein [Gammaproteobacteria bacterium]